MKKIDLIYLIDDDAIFAFVFKKVLDKTLLFEEIKIFKNGYLALENLEERYKNKEKLPQYIFLDINMPLCDGWQFLYDIEKLPFKDELKIFMISSSIDEMDIEKANKFKNVLKFISKPITSQDIINLIKKHE